MERNAGILIHMKKGFTLLEITVVVSIIIFLSTIFIANYRGGEKQFALSRSTNKLAQDLRKVEEMALSSQRTPDAFEPDTFPKGGYGVYFRKGATSYILFADCDGNGIYSEPGSAPTCAAAGGLAGSFLKGEKLEEFYFEEGVYIKDITPISGDNSFSITFFPPDPKVTINPQANSASVYLTFDGVTEKIIKINIAGLIDID